MLAADSVINGAGLAATRAWLWVLGLAEAIALTGGVRLEDAWPAADDPSLVQLMLAVAQGRSD